VSGVSGARAASGFVREAPLRLRGVSMEVPMMVDAVRVPHHGDQCNGVWEYV